MSELSFRKGYNCFPSLHEKDQICFNLSAINTLDSTYILKYGNGHEHLGVISHYSFIPHSLHAILFQQPSHPICTSFLSQSLTQIHCSHTSIKLGFDCYTNSFTQGYTVIYSWSCCSWISSRHHLICSYQSAPWPDTVRPEGASPAPVGRNGVFPIYCNEIDKILIFIAYTGTLVTQWHHAPKMLLV